MPQPATGKINDQPAKGNATVQAATDTVTMTDQSAKGADGVQPADSTTTLAGQPKVDIAGQPVEGIATD